MPNLIFKAGTTGACSTSRSRIPVPASPRPCTQVQRGRCSTSLLALSGSGLAVVTSGPQVQACPRSQSGRSEGRGARIVCPVAAAAAPEAQGAKRLIELPLMPLVNTSGNVAPDFPEGSKQSVYAIYDEQQRLQFIGMGHDLRNALRTVLGRRPDKAFYYRAVTLTSNELEDAAAVRDAWFQECGGAPKGNKMAMERAAWTQPVDAGAISERGKRGAAENAAKALVAALRARGCVEDFSPNTALLDQGLVDFMAVEGLSAEEQEEQRAAAEARAAQCRSVVTVVDGMDKKFLVMYELKMQTRGGYMVDVVVTADHCDTRHRVIVGKSYYEPMGLPVEAAVEAALAVIVALKLPRHTEGMLDSSTFPVNYFSVSELDQWFGDDFEREFARVTGAMLEEEDERAKGFWRFNRLFDYGSMRTEDAGRGQI